MGQRLAADPDQDTAKNIMWKQGSPLFAYRIFYLNLNINEKYQIKLKLEMDLSNG